MKIFFSCFQDVLLWQLNLLPKMHNINVYICSTWAILLLQKMFLTINATMLIFFSSKSVQPIYLCSSCWEKSTLIGCVRVCWCIFYLSAPIVSYITTFIQSVWINNQKPLKNVKGSQKKHARMVKFQLAFTNSIRRIAFVVVSMWQQLQLPQFWSPI